MEEQKEDNEFIYEGEFTKIEESSDGHIYIAGICTTEKIDHDGEIVDLNEVRGVWDDYMQNPVLKYMHGKDPHNVAAIGKVVPEHVDGEGKTWKTEFTDRGPFIVCKISNAPDTESIRTKVTEGILKGFSIGGRARRVKIFDPTLQKDVNRVITTRISEVSLVDLPANSDSFFSVLKAACTGPDCPLNTNGTESIEKDEGKLPADWWDNCIGTAKGIPGMDDASAFCGWMWAHGEDAGFTPQRAAIGKSEVEDPVVEQAVVKFEEIITQNNTLQEEAAKMKNRLEKFESEIQNIVTIANDPEFDITKGEENENNDHISTMNKNVEVDGITGGITMEQDAENGIVRMEVPELEDFIKSTVEKIAEENETVEKLDDYDRLLKETLDMRKRIEELEGKVTAQANALKAKPQEAMKSEEDPEPVEKQEKKDDKKKDEKKYDEEGNEIIDEAEMKIKKMEAEIKALKESPLYKAQQDEVPPGDAVVAETPTILGGVIKAHYGGN